MSGLGACVGGMQPLTTFEQRWIAVGHKQEVRIMGSLKSPQLITVRVDDWGRSTKE